jgi:hypothetical protein
VIPLRDSRYAVSPKQNKSAHELVVRIIGQGPGNSIVTDQTVLNPRCESSQVLESAAQLEESDIGKALSE